MADHVGELYLKRAVNFVCENSDDVSQIMSTSPLEFADDLVAVPVAGGLLIESDSTAAKQGIRVTKNAVASPKHFVVCDVDAELVAMHLCEAYARGLRESASWHGSFTEGQERKLLSQYAGQQLHEILQPGTAENGPKHLQRQAAFFLATQELLLSGREEIAGIDSLAQDFSEKNGRRGDDVREKQRGYLSAAGNLMCVIMPADFDALVEKKLSEVGTESDVQAGVRDKGWFV